MSRVFIIAEAGVNHNGSLDLALRLIDTAVEAGADSVKFQSFKASNIASSAAPKADYQRRNELGAESQLEMLRRLELDEESHMILARHCKETGIEFLSTPFDLESVDLLADRMSLRRLKLPSGEITNAPLLLHAARTGKPLIVSTGMSDLNEIEAALGVIAFGYASPRSEPRRPAFDAAFHSEEGKALLRQKVSLLHCTSEYPAPLPDVNLRAMDTLSEKFGLPVGLSDHTVGISVAIAAAARGARIIEKHFTLDRTLPGPDHKASLEPAELRDMVRSIREVEQALGTRGKTPTASESGNRAVARRSLVAACDIRKGERFSAANLAVKRPGTGVSPMLYWDWLGRIAERDYSMDEVISP